MDGKKLIILTFHPIQDPKFRFVPRATNPELDPPVSQPDWEMGTVVSRVLQQEGTHTIILEATESDRTAHLSSYHPEPMVNSRLLGTRGAHTDH